MSSSNKPIVVQGVPLTEATAIANPEQAGRTIFGSIMLNKPSIIKLLILIVYVIIVCYFLVNNPGKIVSDYSSLFLIISLLGSVFLFYNAVKSNTAFIDFKFDNFKKSVILLCFLVLSLFFYYYNPGGYIMQYMSTPIYACILASLIFFVLFLMLNIYFSYFSMSFIAWS